MQHLNIQSPWYKTSSLNQENYYFNRLLFLIHNWHCQWIWCSCNAYTHHVRDISLSFTEAHKNWHHETQCLWGECQSWPRLSCECCSQTRGISPEIVWNMSICGSSQSGSVNQLGTAPVIRLECAFHAQHTLVGDSLSPARASLEFGCYGVTVLLVFDNLQLCTV